MADNSVRTEDNVNPLAHVDLSKPRYDQSNYIGRAKHFFEVTDPRNVIATTKQLEQAKEIVLAHKAGKTPPGTTEEQLWHAKKLHDSAYHPFTGQLMFLPGRMSFQVPGNMVITGCMLTFYRTPAQTIFWQWANQSFNSGVNYTNRSGDSISLKQLLVPYLSATVGAVVTALSLNQLAKKLPPLVGKCVPFTAVAAANCINIPLMRQKELKEGILVTDKDGTTFGSSKKVAKRAISMVIFSRIIMAAPAMIIPQVIMNSLEKRSKFIRASPRLQALIQVLSVGLCLTFSTPLCCALFPQQSSISVAKLEPNLQEAIAAKSPETKIVYFNKGL